MSPGSDYVSIMPLAEGGMGCVEVALRKRGDFQRLCAVKRLLPRFCADRDMRQMFLDEARVAGLIRHPNVVGVLDMGEDAEGPYMVMDYVDGVSLAAFLHASAKRGEALPTQHAVTIAAAVSRALTVAHELTDLDGQPLGLIHRDVSPQNILIGFDGSVQLTDFGIAKVLHGQQETEAGVLKGKLGYSSPEQLSFQPLTEASDLFSLGIVLFEMVAGRRLYGRPSSRSGKTGPERIVSDPAPDLGEERGDLPPGLVELAHELLAKVPADRPASAREVTARLDRLQASLRIERGVLALSEHVAELCSTERSQRTWQLREALDRARADGLAAVQQGSSPGEDSSAPVPEQGGRRRLGALLVAVALLALGGGAWLAYVASDDPVVSAPSPEPPTALADREPQEPPTTHDLEPTEGSEPTPELSPLAPTETADPPAHSKTRRSRSRRSRSGQGRSGRNAQPPSGGLVLEEW